MSMQMHSPNRKARRAQKSKKGQDQYKGLDGTSLSSSLAFQVMKDSVHFGHGRHSDGFKEMTLFDNSAILTKKQSN